MATVILKKGEGRTLSAGGAWIYDNEIDRVDGGFTDGDLVLVQAANGFPLGTGFINTRSKLTVRMLSRDQNSVVDAAFLRRRVHDCVEYRRKTVDMNSCRLIFGEADFLPGFVADKFADVLVIQSLALGIDRFKPLLVDALQQELAAIGMPIRGVFERSDAKVRLQEGLDRVKGFLGDPFDPQVEILENNLRFLVDVAEGQKTGYFLDQKENRAAIRKLCKGAKVLDCFTHTGSFALNAAAAGASEVLAVDASDLAVAQGRRNASLNGLDHVVRFQCADVFELLPTLEQAGEQYDVVILDPPAFTKSRSSVKNAMRGYRDINLRGLRLLRDGGFLCTCSCSHFMTPELFSQAVAQAAHDARKRLRQVEYRTQAPDHPILWAAEESYYLKFFILQAVNER